MPTPTKDPVTGQFVKTDPETPAAPEVQPPKPAAPTEVPEAVEEFLSQGIGIKIGRKAKDKPKEEPKPAPAPKPRPRPLSAPAVTPEAIATAAAEAVARVMKPEAKPQPTPEPAEEPGETEVLRVMERLYPDEYKGIAKRYADSVKKLEEYAAKWEADHPGERFDDDAEEHAEFIAANDVFWDDRHYIKAAVELETERRLAPERERAAAERRQAEAEQQHAPVLTKIEAEALRAFWDLNKVKEPEKFDDPVAKPIMDRLGANLRFETTTLYRMMSGLEPWIDKEPPLGTTDRERLRHDTWLAQREMAAFATKEEQRFSAKPDDETLDNEGRHFLSAAEYYKLKEPDRANYWTFTASDIALLRARELASEAKRLATEEEDRLAKFAERRGYVRRDKATENGKPTAPEPEPLPDETDGDLASPAAVPQSRVAATRQPTVRTPKSDAESFVLGGIG